MTLQQRLWTKRGIDLIAPKRGGERPSTRHQDRRKLRRRIATRWDVKSANFFGFLQLACSVLLLRALRLWL